MDNLDERLEQLKKNVTKVDLEVYLNKALKIPENPDFPDVVSIKDLADEDLSEYLSANIDYFSAEIGVEAGLQAFELFSEVSALIDKIDNGDADITANLDKKGLQLSAPFFWIFYINLFITGVAQSPQSLSAGVVTN